MNLNLALRPTVARLVLACTLVATFNMAALRLQAQEEAPPTTGSARGTVVDPNGEAIKGAKVALTSNAIGQSLSATTGADGGFSFADLAPGDYVLHVEKATFKPWQTTVTVQAGVATRTDVSLESTTPVVNVKTVSVQSVLKAPAIENLPINSREFLEIGQLEPGIQVEDGVALAPQRSGFPALSFQSHPARSGRIDLDDVDITDEISGSSTQNLPQESVQEFQLQQSMLDLSKELTSSGAINIVTKSGANAYHGEGYYYFRDQQLDADLPAATHNHFQRSQFGGAFGGALIKDKAFFFLDASRIQQNLQNPVIPGYPFQNLIGSFNAPTRELQGVGRLDWQIRDQTRFFYRISYDQNSTVSTVAPSSFQPFANEVHTPDHAAGLDFVTGKYTHSVRFSYLRFHDDLSSAVTGNVFDPVPGIELAIGADPYCLGTKADAFCSGQPYAAPQASYQSNMQVKYDGGRIMGKHTFRYGAAFNRIQGGGFGNFLNLGPLVGSPLDSSGFSDPSLYPATNVVLSDGQGFYSEKSAFGLAGGGLGPDNRLFFYVGDAIKLKENLTLTLGTSYAHETGKLDSDLGVITTLNQFGAGLGDRVKNPSLNFAPQVGLAWDPNNSGKTVIRVGGGLFYDDALWSNLMFDRPGRLTTGLFHATQPLCSDGAPVSFLLPGTSTLVDPSGICGQPIGNVASQIIQLQQQLQGAWAAAGATANPAYIGNVLASGMGATGASLLNPNYKTPRSVQANFGIQHQFRHGAVFSLDYLHSVTTHTLLALDTNHVGDATHMDTDAALAAINATVSSVGCGPVVSAGASSESAVNCYLAAVPNASIADFAVHGLDSANSFCGGRPCSSLSTPGNPHAAAAFPGINPNVGTNQMLSPIGRSVYEALQFGFRQDVHSPFREVRGLHLQFSYALSRYKSMEQTSGLINSAGDNNSPSFYYGFNGLDRKHQISFGGTMDLPLSFRLGLIGHFASPLPLTLTLAPNGTAGGIFMTDLTGDGSGDGSLVSNGIGTGDILPGTNIGSYGRGVKPGKLNTVIDNYNTSYSGKVTPAGSALLNASLFTQVQLARLGGVMPVVTPASVNQVQMPWLRSFDLNLSWVHKIREGFEIEPGVSFYNVMNLSNFDSPNNLLSGVVNGTPGSVNGTALTQPENLRVGAGSGVFALGSPRVLEIGLKARF